MTLFEALADPIRREIVQLVATGEMNAGEIASRFDVTRPAVSRHLRVLRESGLLQSRGDAQRRIYTLDPRALDELEEWVERTRSFWSGRLARLDSHLTTQLEEKVDR
jgi:DNA-binding transcriptional ArsR family regulator